MILRSPLKPPSSCVSPCSANHVLAFAVQAGTPPSVPSADRRDGGGFASLPDINRDGNEDEGGAGGNADESERESTEILLIRFLLEKCPYLPPPGTSQQVRARDRPPSYSRWI